MTGTSDMSHQQGGHNPHTNRKRHHASSWSSRGGTSRRRFAKKIASAPQQTPSKPMCSVCNKVENPKYKCPKCRGSYCSIKCCRDHKERGCSETSKQTKNMGESKTTSTSSTESKYCPQQEIDKLTAESKASESQAENQSDCHEEDDLEEGWKMTNSMLEAMKRSTWLKNELKDAGLRQLVLKIMRASDLARRNKSRTKQEEELDQAKADFPRFKKFIDKLLVLTGILERHGDEASIDLDEWLEKEQAVDGLSSDTQLILKPISRPTSNPTVAKEVAESNEEQIDVAATASTSEDSGDDSSDDDSSSSSDDDDEDSSSHGNKNV